MTAYELASRFVGEVHEVPGVASSPFIQWCHESCSLPATTPDEVPWCSSFVNRICWILRLPRSASAAARSWLIVGKPVDLADAVLGDIVVIKRGTGNQPGPSEIRAPGHVGFLVEHRSVDHTIIVLGGNQSNGVTTQAFKEENILGIRRLT